MELFEYPNKSIWQKRSQWIEKEIEDNIKGSYMISEQAVALFADLQACYCVGAWLSVIILSISIIDSHLRETEAFDGKIGTAKLLNDFYEGEDDINWLRKLRNKYVHLNLNQPAFEMNDHYNKDKRNEMENDAKRAIKMIIQSFFQSPGI